MNIIEKTVFLCRSCCQKNQQGFNYYLSTRHICEHCLILTDCMQIPSFAIKEIKNETKI